MPRAFLGGGRFAAGRRDVKLGFLRAIPGNDNRSLRHTGHVIVPRTKGTSMSDNAPSTAAGGQSGSHPAGSSQKKHNPVRLMILILLLLLVAGAYGYDRKVAGPACEAGQKKILGLLAQQQAQPGKVTASFAEVQKTLGKKPSSRIDKEYYSIETYSWMRGSLFQTYFIRVIYRKDRDGALAVDGVTAPNEEPSESQLPVRLSPANSPRKRRPVSSRRRDRRADPPRNRRG